MLRCATTPSEARKMQDVCKDAGIEPGLIPTLAEMTKNTDDEARLDFAVRGVWGACDRTPLDVRVTTISFVNF